MKLKTPPTFSDDTVDIHIPKSWDDMNQAQLRYALYVLSVFTSDVAKIYMLCRFGAFRVLLKNNEGWLCYARDSHGRNVRFQLFNWQIDSFAHQLDFVDTSDNMHIRLDRLQNRGRAVDAMLHDVPFIDYLTMDNYYQSYIVTNDVTHLVELANILYRTKFSHLTDMSVLAVITWWSAVKYEFAKQFKYLFRPAKSLAAVDMQELMNSEIRGLTGGDVTKEDAVLHQDCWRALTELDCKARECAELKSK